MNTESGFLLRMFTLRRPQFPSGPEWLQRDEPLSGGDHHGFGSAARAKLGVEVVEVVFHGLDAQNDPPCSASRRDNLAGSVGDCQARSAVDLVDGRVTGSDQ